MTPMGVAVGTGISSVYDENRTTALVVEGVLNSAAAGILIYMALVDILAADLLHPKVAELHKASNISQLLPSPRSRVHVSFG